MRFFQKSNLSCLAVDEQSAQAVIGAKIFKSYDSYGAGNTLFCFVDTVTDVYLREFCKEISRDEAAKLHPNLLNFIKIDQRITLPVSAG